jgi:hypothetical protein
MRAQVSTYSTVNFQVSISAECQLSGVNISRVSTFNRTAPIERETQGEREREIERERERVLPQ